MKQGRWYELAKNVATFVIYAMVVAMFLVWVAFGNRTVANQNKAILAGVRADVTVHAEGTAHRTCALADELLYLASHPAKVNGQSFKLTRPQEEVAKLTELRNEACKVEPLP